MSDDEKRRLRDEVAELSAAVRELREQLAQPRPHVCCPGICCCHLHGHWHYWPNPAGPAPYVVTYPQYQTVCGSTSVASGVPNTATVTYTNTVGGQSTALGAINYS